MQHIITIQHPDGSRLVYPTVFEEGQEDLINKTAESLRRQYPHSALGLVEIDFEPTDSKPNIVH